MFQPLIKNLTTADGMVATTAAEITHGTGQHARRLTILFGNAGTETETLVLTVSRNGGAARFFRQVVLEPAESVEFDGFPLNNTDSLLAATTNAGAVAYIVAVAAENSLREMTVYDANGAPKSAPAVLEQMVQLLG